MRGPEGVRFTIMASPHSPSLDLGSPLTLLSSSLEVVRSFLMKQSFLRKGQLVKHEMLHKAKLNNRQGSDGNMPDSVPDHMAGFWGTWASKVCNSGIDLPCQGFQAPCHERSEFRFLALQQGTWKHWELQLEPRLSGILGSLPWCRELGNPGDWPKSLETLGSLAWGSLYGRVAL